LAKNHAFSPLFQRFKVQTRREKGNFGGAPTESIVLDAKIEQTNPLLDTILSFSRSQSDFTTSLLENRQKGRFAKPKSVQTRRKNSSFGSAASGLIVLNTIIETNKHSYVHFASFSLSQSDFTSWAKTPLFRQSNGETTMINGSF